MTIFTNSYRTDLITPAEKGCHCPKYKDMTPEQREWYDDLRNSNYCPPWCPDMGRCINASY